MADRIDPFLLTTEIRGISRHDLWLSPAYGRDTIGIHFSWARDLEAVPVISAEIEALLPSLGGRPHRGKIIHALAAGLAGVYPRLPAFRELARSLDRGESFAMRIRMRMCLEHKRGCRQRAGFVMCLDCVRREGMGGST